MKKYTYYFADGTKSTIEVEDKWYDIYEGNAFVDDKADPFENLMREKQREQLDAAIATLTDCQRELFETYFVDGKKVTEIAEEQGVCHQAVSARIERIKRKLQKFLG